MQIKTGKIIIYNPYNFLDIIISKKDSEEKNSNNKKEYKKVIILGYIYTCSQICVSCYYIIVELFIKNNKKIKEIDLTRDLIKNIKKSLFIILRILKIVIIRIKIL
jgi:hypothetical protein